MKRRTANSLTAWAEYMREAIRRGRAFSAEMDRRAEMSEPAPAWAVIALSLILTAGALWVAAIVIGA